MRSLQTRALLPLPRWVLHPFTAFAIAGVHLYLAGGHLLPLFGGDIRWEHTWKGFGALGGTYIFAALALRELARSPNQAEPGAERPEAETSLVMRTEK